MKRIKTVKLAAGILVLAIAAASVLSAAAEELQNEGKVSGIAVGGEVKLLTAGNEIQSVSSETLTVERVTGGAHDVINITKIPDGYTDNLKTLMIVKPRTDLSDIKKNDIIAIDQSAEISKAELDPIDVTNGAGTYTVLMGGSRGVVYMGEFVVSSSEQTAAAEYDGTFTSGGVDEADSDKNIATAYHAVFSLDDTKTYTSPTVTWSIDYTPSADEVGTTRKGYWTPRKYADITNQSTVKYGLVITGKAIGEDEAAVTASFEAKTE